MRKSTILITGSNGEMGHGLIKALSILKNNQIISLDISPIDEIIRPYIVDSFNGSILDDNVLNQINE